MNIKDATLYETEIYAIKKELSGLPAGHLSKKGPFYFVTVNTVQKGITKDRQKTMQLARKAYLLQRLGRLERNLSLVKKLAGRYESEDPADIIRKLPPFYHTLPVNYFFHTSIHKKFENTTEGNAGFKDGLIYLTNSGIRVRSKSERTIADMLDQNGILYNYEAALALGGGSRRPDFTIYRPSDGRMILWEHLGLMENDGYRQKVNEKLALYNRFGFYQFDNLICTFEQDLQNTAKIQAIIDMLLLQ